MSSKRGIILLTLTFLSFPAISEELHLVCTGEIVRGFRAGAEHSVEVIVNLQTSEVTMFSGVSAGEPFEGTFFQGCAGRGEPALAAEVYASRIKIVDACILPDGQDLHILDIKRTDGSYESLVTTYNILAVGTCTKAAARAF